MNVEVDCVFYKKGECSLLSPTYDARYDRETGSLSLINSTLARWLNETGWLLPNACFSQSSEARRATAQCNLDMAEIAATSKCGTAVRRASGDPLIADLLPVLEPQS